MSINKKTDVVYVSKHVTYLELSPSEEISYIKVDTENEFYSNDEFGVLFNKDKTKLIRGVCGLGTYHIPPSVKEIGKGAFDFIGAWDIELVIPEGVEIINDNAFILIPECPELPQSVTTLGESFCVGSFTIGKNVCNISEGVSFYDDPVYVDPENQNFVIYDDALYSMDMTRLLLVFSKKEIYYVPECVEKIDMNAFFGNFGIKKIYLPSSVKYIGRLCFPEELEALHISPYNQNFIKVDGALVKK